MTVRLELYFEFVSVQCVGTDVRSVPTHCLLVEGRGDHISSRRRSGSDMGPALGQPWSGLSISTYRAEDEQNQLQSDVEAVLRQCKQARERKYDQVTISYLNKHHDTARRTIWALRR